MSALIVLRMQSEHAFCFVAGAAAAGAETVAQSSCRSCAACYSFSLLSCYPAAASSPSLALQLILSC
eukprot:scaffold25961_cov13-Tisochrysis_lutea.AAC.1